MPTFPPPHPLFRQSCAVVMQGLQCVVWLQFLEGSQRGCLFEIVLEVSLRPIPPSGSRKTWQYVEWIKTQPKEQVCAERYTGNWFGGGDARGASEADF